MQKSKVATIGIIIIIGIYVILSSIVLIYQHNFSYLYIINPVFYILIAISLKVTIGKTLEKTKIKKEVLNCVLVAVISYIIIYLISGLFVTFGKNPYSTNFVGVFINCWILGIPAILREYIRYKLINNVYEKDKIKIAVFISIIYIFIESEVYIILSKEISAIVLIKFLAVTVLPLIIKNILFSYIDMNADLKSVIVYDFITRLFMWTCPILPNSPWIMNSVIEIMVPLLCYIYICYIKGKKYINVYQEKVIENDPKSYIAFIIIIILFIWFIIGVFPVKPIAVATASMEPEIFIGDVAIIKKCNVNDVIVGDIIEYSLDDITVIHRVVKKEQIKGEILFTTKGDNNRQEDDLKVNESQLLGKVIFKIKYIGYPSIWLHLLQEEKQVNVSTGDA